LAVFGASKLTRRDDMLRVARQLDENVLALLTAAARQSHEKAR